MRRTSKAETVEAMRRMIAEQKGTVVAEYRGLTVAEITGLRRKLRDANAEFRVVKNTLIRLAAKDTGFGQLEDFFSGPTAIGVTKTDPVTLAKAMKDFAGANRKIRVKAGYLDGKVLTPKEVETLANIPSREVLLSMLARSLAGPLAKLAQVLSGPQRKLAYALQSIHDNKSKQDTA